MSDRHARSSTRRLAGLAVVATLVGFGFAARPASATGTGYGPGVEYNVVSQAVPDECWIPPADPANPADYGQYAVPTGHDANGGVICPAGSQPKVNQAYVWGLTRVGDDLFFGTAPNVVCLVLGGYLGVTTPMEVPGAWTCEFGSSPTAKLGVPAAAGDWRPSNLYVYHMASKSTVDLVSLQTPALQAALKGKLAQTLGIRSAGEAVNPLNPAQTVVFFAGPALSTSGGINLFAFDQTGTFLGATTLPAYDNIRKWLNVPADSNGGQRLYAGVNVTNAGKPYGAIVKWTPSAGNLFSFTTVGTTNSDVAELAAAGDRIYADTWPNATSQAGLYMSPISSNGSPDGGLNGGAWTELWQAGNYEPDPVTAMTYGGGALTVYDGYVYWGTMHVPFVAAGARIQMTPPQTAADGIADIVGTNRAVSIFRMKVGTTSPQLLYGDSHLLAFLPDASNPGTSSWQIVPNKMGGVAGLYGTSGFGNPFNNYTWSMGVYDDQLYVGTMDWSYLLAQGWPQLSAEVGLPAGTPNPFSLLSPGFGADLWRFGSTSTAAQAISVNGMDNPLSYGIRNMLSVMSAQGVENGLYLGMANPMNLATTGPNLGGWKLIQLSTNVTGQNFALTVAPTSQSQVSGQPATLTAVLTADGKPVPSADVTFTFTSGPAAGQTVPAVTDATGRATLTWSRTYGGPETVKASAAPTNVFGYPIPVSATATVNWAGIEPAHSGPVGYLLTASDGGVFAYGGAGYYGSAAGYKLAAPVVGMDRTPSGHGYWLVASDGGVFAYGDARYYGSAAGFKLSAPAVDIMPAQGSGYWIVSQDGGVFSFGGASFHGSLGGASLGSRIVSGLAAGVSGGYLLTGSDGHVYPFGDATWRGDMSTFHLGGPIVSIDASLSGAGYLMAGSDGGVFAYGDARFAGSAAGYKLVAPIVHIATR